MCLSQKSCQARPIEGGTSMGSFGRKYDREFMDKNEL